MGVKWAAPSRQRAHPMQVLRRASSKAISEQLGGPLAGVDDGGRKGVGGGLVLQNSSREFTPILTSTLWGCVCVRGNQLSVTEGHQERIGGCTLLPKFTPGSGNGPSPQGYTNGQKRAPATALI